MFGFFLVRTIGIQIFAFIVSSLVGIIIHKYILTKKNQLRGTLKGRGGGNSFFEASISQ